MQNPLEANSFSDLTSCRRCGKHIDREATICPYCGHHVRRARRLIGAAWTVAALLVVGVVGYGVYRGGYLQRFLPDRPAELAVVPDSVPAAPDTATPTASPIVVPQPDTARADSAPVPAPAAPAPSAVATPAPPRSFQARWTSDWANVREGPSVTAPVVRVLAPGRQVDVANMRDGWWTYYEEGAVRGYIANSVLESQPPGLGLQR